MRGVARPCPPTMRCPESGAGMASEVVLWVGGCGSRVAASRFWRWKRLDRNGSAPCECIFLLPHVVGVVEIAYLPVVAAHSPVQAIAGEDVAGEHADAAQAQLFGA